MVVLAVLVATAAGLAVPVRRRDIVFAGVASVSLPARAAEEAPGLIIEDVQVGQGDMVKPDSVVSIGYKAWLDGFDSAKKFADVPGPSIVPLGQDKIAKGLETALVSMRVGGKRRVTIPADLGYGDTGFPREGDKKGAIIPPGATLYFEVRVRSIKLSQGLGFGLNLF